MMMIISIEMMRASMSGDQASKWSGIESKKQRDQELTPWGTLNERTDLEDRQLTSLIL